MTYTKPLQFAPVFTNLLTDMLENSPITEEIFGKNNFLKKPATNITEMENAYQLDLLVPGFQKTDFQLSVEKNILTVSAKASIEEATENTKNVRREFEITEFKRSFNISENIDAENINAKYNNGILRITLTKKEPKVAQSKKINVD
jgi:HSP20 family protein